MTMRLFFAATGYRWLAKAATSKNARHPNLPREGDRQTCPKLRFGIFNPPNRDWQKTRCSGTIVGVGLKRSHALGFHLATRKMHLSEKFIPNGGECGLCRYNLPISLIYLSQAPTVARSESVVFANANSVAFAIRFWEDHENVRP